MKIVKAISTRLCARAYYVCTTPNKGLTGAFWIQFILKTKETAYLISCYLSVRRSCSKPQASFLPLVHLLAELLFSLLLAEHFSRLINADLHNKGTGLYPKQQFCFEETVNIVFRPEIIIKKRVLVSIKPYKYF